VHPPPPPPPPPPPAQAIPAAFRQALEDLNPVKLGGGIKPPALVYEVKPVYPPDLRELKVEGSVMTEVIVDTVGNVYEARVVAAVPGLEQAALDAVKQWRFQPALLNGEPVAVLCNVEFTFTVK
jgi:protein TonB